MNVEVKKMNIYVYEMKSESVEITLFFVDTLKHPSTENKTFENCNYSLNNSKESVKQNNPPLLLAEDHKKPGGVLNILSDRLSLLLSLFLTAFLFCV